MGPWNDQPGQPVDRQEAARRLGLLLVDDEPGILESLAEVFRRHFDTHVAASATEALAIMREHAPKVVVSDQRMPGITGLDLMAEIKAIAPDTIRILLTGYSDTEVVIRALNEGLLYKFLTKPWEQDELIRTVQAGAQEFLKRQQGPRVPGMLGC